MGWDRKLQHPTWMVDYSTFVKGFLHPWNPNDLATSTPTSWCIPMACQPLPLLQLVRNSNSPFMNRFIAHQTTFFQIKVPILKGAICPNHDDPLQVLVLLDFDFKRPKQNRCAPIVTNCPTCKTYLTNEHLLKQTTTKLVTLIGIQLETLNPTKIENLVNTPDL